MAPDGNLQEVVRTALNNLYEASRHQSERIEELELELKLKANREDVTAALSQKASAFDVSSRFKKVTFWGYELHPSCCKQSTMCDKCAVLLIINKNGGECS